MPKYKHVSTGVIVSSEAPPEKLAPVFVPVTESKPKATRTRKTATKVKTEGAEK